ncbi:MAG: hypothetical protein J7604_22285 [Sporocytophaga sp.]|uniref:hypothetical protein n=1 Tax=Sporocytophaga sp. TaxID=2231183 RepID=UPI001B001E75|nr:hypothetical protein [Sporocytophaga sp.]MBO9702960.1 hypothetical protein [Sporocytophaga sp.]
MILKEFYNRNKPLINSIITGIIYFIFSWSVDFNEGIKVLFISVMMFLPGLTFPLVTTYYKLKGENKILIHLILSVLIYHCSVWLFSGEGVIKYITIAAGIFGSLLYLIITKLILKRDISFIQIMITSLLSGLAFLPYELIGREGILIGLAILQWNIFNGIVLNHEFKRSIESH